MSVRIITDSASDMSPAEHPALCVLSLSVTFGTDVYMDGVDIDHQRFYEMLVERDELPKTGQVNPYAFSQAIAEAREAGDEAVIITVGAKLSGTNQSARTALAEAPGPTWVPMVAPMVWTGSSPSVWPAHSAALSSIYFLSTASERPV